eukprot:356232-Chlamydomonas_euryale.AAC.22
MYPCLRARVQAPTAVTRAAAWLHESSAEAEPSSALLRRVRTVIAVDHALRLGRRPAVSGSDAA